LARELARLQALRGRVHRARHDRAAFDMGRPARQLEAGLARAFADRSAIHGGTAL
jgi:hypothetical protein